VSREPEPSPCPPPRPAVVEWVAAARLEVRWRDVSKNTGRAPRSGPGPRLGPTPGARRLAGDLRLLLEAALRGRRLRPATPWWIAVHVRRRDLRGDPANVLDLVLDAARDAVGVDDRHAKVWQLTWELADEPPSVEVWVGQEPGAPPSREPARRPRRERRRGPAEPPAEPGARPPW